MKNLSNVITGAIAVSMSLLFLLFYAFRLNDVALWVIIVANTACLVYDYYKSIKEGEENI